MAERACEAPLLENTTVINDLMSWMQVGNQHAPGPCYTTGSKHVTSSVSVPSWRQSKSFSFTGSSRTLPKEKCKSFLRGEKNKSYIPILLLSLLRHNKSRHFTKNSDEMANPQLKWRSKEVGWVHKSTHCPFHQNLRLDPPKAPTLHWVSLCYRVK